MNIRRYCIGIQSSVGKKSEESDEFGTYDLPIDEKVAYDKFDFLPEDSDCQDKHEAVIADTLRPNSEKYLRKLNYLIHEKNNLKEALNTLEVEMKEQLVKPEQAHFRILIHACAQVGHVFKAFQLSKKLKERGLQRHVGIYADLFLACTNCHDKTLALNKATVMRKNLAMDHFIPNTILYHTMIQAFGRCGDLETAFELIDEMRQNKVPVSSETFSFLLQGCLSDRQNGFRHALLTWRAMRRRKVWPNIYNYNLMLKACQDCGLGDIRYTGDIIQACLTAENQIAFERAKIKAIKEEKLKQKRLSEEPRDNGNINSEEARSEENNQFSKIHVVSQQEKDKEIGIVPSHEVPNLLAKRPEVGHIIGLAPVDTAQNRLMLMGGQPGFIQWMKKDHVTPDIKTLDQMLRVIPNTNEAEEELLSLLPHLAIIPDANFCNQLIIQREKRNEIELAKSTLQMMTEYDISPDIMTFGSLARCCKDPKSVGSFLRDFEDLGGRLNKEILTSLIRNMCVALKPAAIARLLKMGEKQQIKPDKRMLHTVERFYQTYRQFIILKEKGRYVPYTVLLEMRENNLVNWENFVSYYKQWLARVKPDLNEDPLLQYKTIKDEQHEANQR